MPESIICDTSVWLYLGYLGRANILTQLYDSVYTTESVCEELDTGRLNRPDIFDPRHLTGVHIVQADPQDIAGLPANRLGPGEQSVLAYARAHRLDIVGLDDRQARNLANVLGLRVIGTVGLLLKAQDARIIMAVHPLLETLQEEGFFISKSLLEYALQRGNEV